MAVIIQERRDTAANWTAANPVLHEGEKGYETDTLKEKLGDGVTVWTLLPYWPVASVASTTRGLGIIIDGFGSPITTGIKAYLQIPMACSISGVTLLADQVGSVVVDIWKDTYANYPPTVADSITAATPPTLVAALAYEDTTLPGWSVVVAADEVLGFRVNSVATITRLTVQLRLTV